MASAPICGVILKTSVSLCEETFLKEPHPRWVVVLHSTWTLISEILTFNEHLIDIILQYDYTDLVRTIDKKLDRINYFHWQPSAFCSNLCTVHEMVIPEEFLQHSLMLNMTKEELICESCAKQSGAVYRVTDIAYVTNFRIDNHPPMCINNVKWPALTKPIPGVIYPLEGFPESDDPPTPDPEWIPDI